MRNIIFTFFAFACLVQSLSAQGWYDVTDWYNSIDASETITSGGMARVYYGVCFGPNDTIYVRSWGLREMNTFLNSYNLMRSTTNESFQGPSQFGFSSNALHTVEDYQKTYPGFPDYPADGRFVIIGGGTWVGSLSGSVGGESGLTWFPVRLNLPIRRTVNCYVNIDDISEYASFSFTVSSGYTFNFYLYSVEVKSVTADQLDTLIDELEQLDPCCECGACCECECVCGLWCGYICDGICAHCKCHCENECECGACCSCTCTCDKWSGADCGGTCEDCECHCDEGGVEVPPGIDGEWPEIPDVNTPLVTIPNDISEGFSTLWSEIRQRLGVDLMIEMMQPQSCKMDILCLDFPIKEFNGAPLPEWKACLDLAEIAKQEWVFFLRTLLLFIIICNWFVAVFVVLRQW